MGRVALGVFFYGNRGLVVGTILHLQLKFEEQQQWGEAPFL